MKLLVLFFSFIFSRGLYAIEWKTETPWQKGRAGSSQSRLIVGHGPIPLGAHEIILGLEFKLAKGWHVYWKNPGEIGFAPKIEWGLPEGWMAEILYPLPQRIKTSSGGEAFGYENSVVYPVVLKGQDFRSESDFPIQLKIDYLVCAIQCVPETVDFKLELAVSGLEKALLSPHETKINQAFANVPSPAEAGAYSVEKNNQGFLLKAFRQTAEQIEDVFLYSPQKKLKWKMLSLSKNSASIAEYQFEIKNPPTAVEFSIVSRNGSKRMLSSLWYGVASQGPSGTSKRIEIQNHPQISQNSASDLSLSLALFFAFLGGLILNLMPCVLPVILLKTTGLLKTQLLKRSVLSKRLAMTGLGVISSFLCLSFFILFLQNLGRQVGWGFHFQSPGFVSFMAFLIFLFALNLFEVFELNLNSQATNKIHSWGKTDFFEGVFATLLATPCSAPFLGTALTFAFSQPSFTMILTFLAMGLGLSTPYWLLILFPQALKILPKPGIWMNSLKRILGYSLLLTSLWLLYILHQQTTPTFIFGMVLGLILSFFILRELKTPLKWGLVSAILVSSIFLSENFSRSTELTESPDKEFSEARLEQALTSGKIIYLDITADWCLTCQYNASFVTNTRWFRELLEKYHTEELILDWTNRDAQIGSFLEKQGRVGIPFSMLISKDKKILFPELLTEKNVKAKFEEFFGKP